MIKEKEINEIEKNIRNILDSNKDLIELEEEFDEFLKELHQNINNLNSRKIKLLNILTKTPIKKKLFDFQTEETDWNKNKKTYEFALNKQGLGFIHNSYEKNLRNINQYWYKGRFNDLLKDNDFRDILLNALNSHFKGQHKQILKKLIVIDEDNENYEIQQDNLTIEIGNYLNFRLKGEEDNSYMVDLLKIEKINQINLTDLKNFCELLEYKDFIMNPLKEKLEQHKNRNKQILIKLKEIDKELIPYETMENI